MLKTRFGVAPAAGSEQAPPAVWDVAVDLLLQRAALIERLRQGRAPDPLAGLKVDDEDVRAILAQLPGLGNADEGAIGKIEAAMQAPIAEARAALAGALRADVSFGRLVEHARLDDLEAELLALLCAVEADPLRQRLVSYLNDDVTQRRLNLWSLQKIFGIREPVLQAIMPGSRLRRSSLLLPIPEGTWSSAPVAAAPAVLWSLASDAYLDPDLPPGVEVVESDQVGTATLLAVAGPDRIRRLEAALHSIRAERCLVSPLPTDGAQWDALIRKATVFGEGILLEVLDELSTAARERIEAADHLCWGVLSDHHLPLPSLFRRDWVEPPLEDRLASEAEWAIAFPEQLAAERLSPYRLSAAQLYHAQRAARALGGGVREAVQRLAAGHIDQTADRLHPTRTWDDLVLDDERLGLVREIAVRQRTRDVVHDQWGFSAQPSSGVIALFAGPSGTGKTLAAEVIAGDLGVDLYRIDLANLVSKYIGETEKNLARVFEAAEASSVVLFFDEADALLGKRSQVSDAHDRYANIEVAYLLQRLERYDGVAVLATNLASNLDQAFLRRIHVIVEFAVPGTRERALIWRRSLPEKAPLASDVDLDKLADEIEMTGGTIRNVCLRAGYLAAEAGAAITMEILLLALRREFAKMGRLANSSQWEDTFLRKPPR